MVRDANGQPPRYLAFQTQKTTDDRGIYRLYGLLPGTYVVSTGGRGTFNAFFDPYDTDAPTYAPSSTRDTAAEITVRAGEEMSGVDIRYRGEPGRTISGIVSGSLDPNSNFSSNVTSASDRQRRCHVERFSFQPPSSKGFVFYGIADGDYDLVAQSSLGPGRCGIIRTATHLGERVRTSPALSSWSNRSAQSVDGWSLKSLKRRNVRTSANRCFLKLWLSPRRNRERSAEGSAATAEFLRRTGVAYHSWRVSASKPGAG